MLAAFFSIACPPTKTECKSIKGGIKGSLSFPFFAWVQKFSLSRWNSFADLSFWTSSLLSINSCGYSPSGSFLVPSSHMQPLPGLGFYLFSLPVASGINCLFPSLDLASRIPTQTAGSTGRDQFIQFPRQPPDGTVSRDHLTPRGLGWWVVTAIGACWKEEVVLLTARQEVTFHF